MKKENILSHLDFRAYYSSQVPSLRRFGEGNLAATGLCPFQEDKNPSLSVNLKSGLWFCFAGCGGGDVFEFHKRKAGCDFPTALRELAEFQRLPVPVATTEQKVVAEYRYTGCGGNVLYIKERLEPGSEGRGKEFRFKHPDGERLIPGRGADPVPYNLPGFISSKYVVVVEGEGKADLLTEWGVAATSLDAGASSPWKEHYLEYFKEKRKVAVIPDNDKPGYSYAEKIAAALHGSVGELKIVSLPGLEDGQDIVDWSRIEGNGKERLFELIKGKPVWNPEEAKNLKEPEEEPFYVTGADLIALEINIEWVIEKLLPKQSVTLLHGKGGVGKSFLGLNIGKAVSQGVSFWEHGVEKMAVYYVDFENALPVLKDRAEKIGAEDVFFFHQGISAPPPKLDSDEWVKYLDLESGLLIVDTLRASQGKEENSSKEMGEIMQRLKELRDRGFTVLLLHHTPKSDEKQYKGSTVISDLCDHTLSLHEQGRSFYFGTGGKTRYKPFSTMIDFDPESGGFVPAEERYSKEIWDMIRERGPINKTALIDLIKEHFDIKRDLAVKLLDGGKGKHWTETPGENNAKIYETVGESF